MVSKSNWGGYREGAGQKPKWNSGETKPIRLPVKLHQQVTEFARLLDSGEYTIEELLSCDINPKVETVTQSNIENILQLNKLKELVNNWQKKAKKTSNPKWFYAKKLLAELEILISEESNEN